MARNAGTEALVVSLNTVCTGQLKQKTASRRTRYCSTQYGRHSPLKNRWLRKSVKISALLAFIKGTTKGNVILHKEKTALSVALLCSIIALALRNHAFAE